MKILLVISLCLFLILKPTYARDTEIILAELPYSPIISNNGDKLAGQSLLYCKTDEVNEDLMELKPESLIKQQNTIIQAVEYMNETVQENYISMRNKVIAHVTMQVALSVLSFNSDSFAAETIAHHVSDGTQPLLPFEFANGVRITGVRAKGASIVYRAEMPIRKENSLAQAMALAGRASAQATVCNDMEMVDDLLGRDIIIQYDYYDANGEFYNSFTINPNIS